MTAFVPIIPKLERLIPRLASNHDGEVIATTRAIGRTLQGAGLDWHDLAAALRPAAKPRDPETEDLREIVESLAARARLLTERETDFLLNIHARLRRGQSVSPKQAKWLRDIHARLGGEQ